MSADGKINGWDLVARDDYLIDGLSTIGYQFSLMVHYIEYSLNNKEYFPAS